MPLLTNPSQGAIEPLLARAVSDANIKRLQHVIVAMIMKSPEAHQMAQKLLLTDHPIESDDEPESVGSASELGFSDDGEEEDEDNEEVADDAKAVVSRKRRADDDEEPQRPAVRRKRFEVCVQCEEEYEVSTNGKRDCRFHPGEKEPDYESDFWADHDEDCHGRIADLGDEYPEGFKWDCCERQGEAHGCKISRHRAS